MLHRLPIRAAFRVRPPNPRDTVLAIDLPAHTLTPGTYRFRLLLAYGETILAQSEPTEIRCLPFDPTTRPGPTWTRKLRAFLTTPPATRPTSRPAH